MTINGAISDYPTTENVNRQHIAETPASSRNTLTTEIDNTPQANDDHYNNLPKTTTTTQDTTSTEGEFFIDTFVSHKFNGSKQHTRAKTGEVLYIVRWKGF